MEERNFGYLGFTFQQSLIKAIIEDVIKEGVKYTGGIGNPNWMGDKVETAIENGVKQTFNIQWPMAVVEETIQKGIKNTYSDVLPKEYDWSNQFDVEEVINNGIKETIGEDYPHTNRIDGVIKNGVKETLSSIYPIERVVEKVVEVGVLEINSMDEWVNTDNIVNKVMNNGIKEVQPLPAQDGNRDWGNYYYRKGNPTKPFNEYLDDAIRFGVKETKTPGDGDIMSTVEWMKENNSTSYPKMIEDVIQSGKLNS